MGRGTPNTILMSAGVGHFIGDEMLIDVVSHRPSVLHFDDTKAQTPVNTLFAALAAPGISPQQREAFQRAADDLTYGRETDTVRWEKMTVSVDAQPTEFDLCRIVDDYWFAIGVRPDVHLALHSRGLPIAGLSLVRIDLEVPEMPADPFEEPIEPERTFPTELRTGGGWTAEPNVHLRYESYEMLSGTVDGRNVELRLEVPHSHTGATGTVGSEELAVSWVIGDNSETPDPIGTIDGMYGSRQVHLSGVFHLGRGYALDHAEVAGHIGGDDLLSRIERASGGLGSSRTVVAEGALGSTLFTVYGTVNSSLTRAVVGGTIGDRDVRLECTVPRLKSRTVTITGTYNGPLPLLLLILGASLYFL
jgi:hypothetical protein